LIIRTKFKLERRNEQPKSHSRQLSKIWGTFFRGPKAILGTPASLRLVAKLWAEAEGCSSCRKALIRRASW